VNLLWDMHFQNHWRCFKRKWYSCVCWHFSYCKSKRKMAIFIHQWSFKLISYKQFVYLFCSIQSFLRALGYFICACPKWHINKTRIVVTPFNILTNLRYKKVKFVKDEIVIRSSKAGLGRGIKKSHVVTFDKRNWCLIKLCVRKIYL
jgi:hypothetical protein